MYLLELPTATGRLNRRQYRKPTRTDGLLDESFHNPTSHKATTIKTLTRRAQLVCNTPDSLRDENRYLEGVFLQKQLQRWLY